MTISGIYTETHREYFNSYLVLHSKKNCTAVYRVRAILIAELLKSTQVRYGHAQTQEQVALLSTFNL